MPRRADQVLTVAQMRAAEEALIAGGTSVDELMQRAGRGAAEWVWRISGARAVTVLCGPGNNGGDGYVIAEAIRERGGEVAVIAALDPATPAARNARALYCGPVLSPDATRRGEVLVDCLFGSGLTRPLSAAHCELLARLAASHERRVAVDLPSGVDSDLGLVLNDRPARFRPHAGTGGVEVRALCDACLCCDGRVAAGRDRCGGCAGGCAGDCPPKPRSAAG